MAKQINHFYEFGSVRLDETNRLLYKNGVQLSVQPRVIETLLVLVKNPHAIVDKETILDAVWPDAAVEEGGLKRNISLLRKALGEEGRFIETLPKRGYRFTAEVKEHWEETPFYGIEETTDYVLQRRASLRIIHEEEVIDPGSAPAKRAVVPAISNGRRKLTSSWRSWSIPVFGILVLAAGFYFTRSPGSNDAAVTPDPIRSIAVLP